MEGGEATHRRRGMGEGREEREEMRPAVVVFFSAAVWWARGERRAGIRIIEYFSGVAQESVFSGTNPHPQKSLLSGTEGVCLQAMQFSADATNCSLARCISNKIFMYTV